MTRPKNEHHDDNDYGGHGTRNDVMQNVIDNDDRSMNFKTNALRPRNYYHENLDPGGHANRNDFTDDANHYECVNGINDNIKKDSGIAIIMMIDLDYAPVLDSIPFVIFIFSANMIGEESET